MGKNKNSKRSRYVSLGPGVVSDEGTVQKESTEANSDPADTSKQIKHSPDGEDNLESTTGTTDHVLGTSSEVTTETLGTSNTMSLDTPDWSWDDADQIKFDANHGIHSDKTRDILDVATEPVPKVPAEDMSEEATDPLPPIDPTHSGAIKDDDDESFNSSITSTSSEDQDDQTSPTTSSPPEVPEDWSDIIVDEDLPAKAAEAASRDDKTSSAEANDEATVSQQAPAPDKEPEASSTISFDTTIGDSLTKKEEESQEKSLNLAAESVEKVSVPLTETDIPTEKQPDPSELPSSEQRKLVAAKRSGAVKRKGKEKSKRTSGSSLKAGKQEAEKAKIQDTKSKQDNVSEETKLDGPDSQPELGEEGSTIPDSPDLETCPPGSSSAAEAAIKNLSSAGPTDQKIDTAESLTENKIEDKTSTTEAVTGAEPGQLSLPSLATPPDEQPSTDKGSAEQMPGGFPIDGADPEQAEKEKDMKDVVTKETTIGNSETGTSEFESAKKSTDPAQEEEQNEKDSKPDVAASESTAIPPDGAKDTSNDLIKDIAIADPSTEEKATEDIVSDESNKPIADVAEVQASKEEGNSAPDKTVTEPTGTEEVKIVSSATADLPDCSGDGGSQTATTGLDPNASEVVESKVASEGAPEDPVSPEPISQPDQATDEAAGKEEGMPEQPPVVPATIVEEPSEIAPPETQVRPTSPTVDKKKRSSKRSSRHSKELVLTDDTAKSQRKRGESGSKVLSVRTTKTPESSKERPKRSRRGSELSRSSKSSDKKPVEASSTKEAGAPANESATNDAQPPSSPKAPRRRNTEREELVVVPSRPKFLPKAVVSETSVPFWYNSSKDKSDTASPTSRPTSSRSRTMEDPDAARVRREERKKRKEEMTPEEREIRRAKREEKRASRESSDRQREKGNEKGKSRSRPAKEENRDPIPAVKYTNAALTGLKRLLVR